jgi:tetratricopeptide (TPR) repeat protein
VKPAFRGHKDFRDDQADIVESLRGRLVEARQLLPEEAIGQLGDIERIATEADVEDDRFRLDLMLAYRDCGAWDDMIRNVSRLPRVLRDAPLPVQQNALAHYRRDGPGDVEKAAAELQQLLERVGPDSETYGLLGLIRKGQFERTGNRGYLDAAIGAYERGWQADREDIYVGINLATLLTVAGRHDEARLVLPQLRTVVEKRVSSGSTDFWELATALELAALERDWPWARRLISDLMSREVSPWMRESTANNLQRLVGALPDADAKARMQELIRDLVPEVAAP